MSVLTEREAIGLHRKITLEEARQMAFAGIGPARLAELMSAPNPVPVVRFECADLEGAVAGAAAEGHTVILAFSNATGDGFLIDTQGASYPRYMAELPPETSRALGDVLGAGRLARPAEAREPVPAFEDWWA